VPTLSLREIVDATGGRLLRGESDTRVESYAIDTRRLGQRGLFFALRGSRTDGHKFLRHAARRGGAAAVVRQPPEQGSEGPPAIIQVEDPEAALARCGQLARKKIRAKLVAVTGSTGKTSTKELLAAGLASTRRVHRTPGNLNNHLGVPLTLLACPDDAEVAVVEMGMNGPGEIAALTRLVKPDVALVTNVRPVHMQFFPSLDDVAAAKGELFALLRPQGTAVVNMEDEHVRVQAARHAGPRITFGRGSSVDLSMVGMEDRFLPGAALTFRHRETERRVQLRLVGAHNAWNALAALASVAASGGDLDAAAGAMAAVEPVGGRGRVHELADGVVVVDDSYNSNPSALASVLGTLRQSRPAGRKILVMGDMLELGENEASYHKEAGKRAAQAGVHLLVGVGPRARGALETARRGGVPETRHGKDAGSVANFLPALVRPGDLVVVKGSRAIQLEKVVEALTSVKVEGT
jgi:UDP-N-acetylmuramoyl-tripeptide--D-alanyl-D-alanine ligase